MAKPLMSTHVLPGNPPVEVMIHHSARAKRYALRVSRMDGRVSLSLPAWASKDAAIEFLHTREAWLRKHLRQTPKAQIAHIGAKLPIHGVLYPILAGSGRAATFEDGKITVPNGPRQGSRIKALLITMARARLAAAVDTHSTILGRTVGRMTLRDTRSRWGSCSAKGDLMFSWRLIMAPHGVLDYVAAHEVAHLVEMNHSQRFWALCGQLCPKHRQHRDWLKHHGATLLAWHFDDAKDGSSVDTPTYQNE